MRKKLTLRDDEVKRAAPPPVEGRGRKWGISASRLDRLHEYARDMRRNPTGPERLLWSRLCNQQLGGFKFRRQQVVGSAIVDFACPARWLCVEVDGDTHTDPEVDRLRDKKLTDVGLRVLRFSDEEVMRDIEGVLQAILTELQKPFDRREARMAAGRQAARPHSATSSPDGEGASGAPVLCSSARIQGFNAPDR